MNAVVKAAAPSGGMALIPQTFDQAMKLAESMARSKMVPPHFQGKPDDCLPIIEMACRWLMSPYAVIQCAAMIHNRPMFEGKLVAAVVNSRGPDYGLVGRLRYDFSDMGDNRKVTVSGMLGGRVESIDVILKDARTTNEWWKKQPDQQLSYHGARVWARRYMPELMLGVNSPEEFDGDRKADDFSGTTVDAKAEPIRPPDAPKATVAEWLAALNGDLEAAQTAEAVDAIIARQDVQKAFDGLRSGAQQRLRAMTDAALARTKTDPDAPSEMEH